MNKSLIMALLAVLYGCADFAAEPEFRGDSDAKLRRGAFIDDGSYGKDGRMDGADGVDGEDGMSGDGGNDGSGSGDSGDDFTGGGEDSGGGKDSGSNDDDLSLDEGEVEDGKPSHFAVDNFCSSMGTKKVGTNLIGTSGVVLKLYDETTLDEVKEYDDEDYRDDLLNTKSVTLNLSGIENGSYIVAICAEETAGSCHLSTAQLDEYRDSSRALIEDSQGLLGIIDQIAVSRGYGESHGTNLVLLKSDGDGCDEKESPLIVNFGDDGLELTSITEGAKFDIDADGQKEMISWIKSPDAAFIILDKDGDGQVSSVDEMFGNNTRGPDGGFASNGFSALAKYDADGDARITAADPVYAKLRLWFDRDGDTIVDVGEFETLAERDVKSIDLSYTDINESDIYGNETRQRSLLQTGSDYFQILDVWFRSL